MAILLNTANVDYQYDESQYDATSTEVQVLLTNATIVKSANLTTWNDEDLIYTITVKNVEEAAQGGLPLTTVVVTDTINPNYATLLENSVTIDGRTATTPTDYTFDETTGLLRLTLSDIPAESQVVITFQAKKVV